MMREKPLFKIGERVRMKPEYRLRYPARKSFVGTVLRIRRMSSGWNVLLIPDGQKTKRQIFIHDDCPALWESIPDVELSLDEVAVALARAVLIGDKTAALALADRVIELCGSDRGHPGERR